MCLPGFSRRSLFTAFNVRREITYVSVPFLLDDNLSEVLTELLPGQNVRKTVELGLSPRADDLHVINLAFEQRRILVSSDIRFIPKCRSFQTKNNCCLWGLVILPNGIEHQRRILSDFRGGRKIVAISGDQATLELG
jgi:predicted nuclease of predicted toxin-antitoxin system